MKKQLQYGSLALKINYEFNLACKSKFDITLCTNCLNLKFIMKVAKFREI